MISAPDEPGVDWKAARPENNPAQWKCARGPVCVSVTVTSAAGDAWPRFLTALSGAEARPALAFLCGGRFFSSLTRLR